MVRVFTVILCAIALASTGCTARSSMVSHTTNSKKASGFKKSLKSPELKSGTVPRPEVNARTLIPLPAAPLLSPQPEPNCEVETTGSSADERQKLDYERQCYRHAEMIVRSRLQLLQGSVDKTISANKGAPIPLPEASLLSPQPEPICETTDTNADERQKLDYERQCYRHAEMIARDRLQLLQKSVDATIDAIRRGERGGP